MGKGWDNSGRHTAKRPIHIDHGEYIISGQCNPLATLIPP